MPTVLEELGIAFKTDFRDGRSLIPVLQGRETGDRVFTADLAENVLGYRTPSRMAMNSGKDKVIINMPPPPGRPGIFRLFGPIGSGRGALRPRKGRRGKKQSRRRPRESPGGPPAAPKS